MIKYCIMSLIMGFSGNKLLGNDKSNKNSIIVASKTLIILALIKFLLMLKNLL